MHGRKITKKIGFEVITAVVNNGDDSYILLVHQNANWNLDLWWTSSAEFLLSPHN